MNFKVFYSWFFLSICLYRRICVYCMWAPNIRCGLKNTHLWLNYAFRSLPSGRDFLVFNMGTSAAGSVSASFSNGQPQTWQAVNQRDYRKPLVLGYTIKSGNGLIKPGTPQQTFWFCLLRAARSLGWMKMRQPFFFCALLPWVSCLWSMYSKTHCTARDLFTLFSYCVNIRTLDKEVSLLSHMLQTPHWFACYKCQDVLRALFVLSIWFS